MNQLFVVLERVLMREGDAIKPVLISKVETLKVCM